VVAALVMRGEHSTVAVPIVRDVIKAYFEKHGLLKPPENQMESQVRVSQLGSDDPPKQASSASKP
jgi:hypothetical protein